MIDIINVCVIIICMLKKSLFPGLICCLIFGSCSVPEKDTPMFFLWARFYAKDRVERRVLYDTEKPEYEIPEFVIFKNRLISQYPELNPVSARKYYVNYSAPFEFYINISILDRNIKEIKFINCTLTLQDNEYNMFDTINKNIFLSEFIDWYNITRFTAGQYRGDFFNENKFIVNNNDEYYYHGFSLGFRELYFDYNLNENIKINYNVIITDIFNNNFSYSFEYLFNRKFEENNSTKHEVIWNEISYEEWKKYL